MPHQWFIRNQQLIILTNSWQNMFRPAQQYTNNASGNLNKNKQASKYKQINIDDMDVQMVSPNFLQNKTLKKPLTEYAISLTKTNPQGVGNYDHLYLQTPTRDNASAVIFKKQDVKVEKKSQPSLSVIDASQLNIKPAYKQQSTEKGRVAQSIVEVVEKDKNTILSAIMRKGLKPEVTIKPEVVLIKQEKKVGPAEAKLKALMGNRQAKFSTEINTKPSVPKKKQTKKDIQADEIGEEIMQQVDEYGNESFQKLSGAYESAIKQSIAAESNIIKESIRESIRQSINSSGIKQSIREDIKQNLASSSRSLKEEIIEQISASKGKSKESIQQVYEQIFEDESLSNSYSKSQNRFKKSQNQKELDLSASKSFRMKTNVVKSLKYAEELTKKQKQTLVPKLNDSKLVEEISKQKQNLKKLHQKISNIMKKQKQNTVMNSQKNFDLYYSFKVQLNRLITSQNFESKLRKLVSFMSIGDDITPNKKYVNELQDNILKNVMVQIQNMKVGKKQLDQVEKIKNQYEQKMKEQLKIQEINLRAEMNQKLSEKDFELKKMIAELESRMMNRTFEKVPFKDNVQIKGEQYQVESDYSIDSDNVSWKADLWQLLPQYEKKKLYDQQSVQVTKFLTDIMVNQLKDEVLDRSVDISFQFPEEYNSIPLSSYQPPQKTDSKPKNSGMSFEKNRDNYTSKSQKSQFLSDLPKLNLKKPAQQLQTSNISASKQELDVKFQKVRRDEKIKPEIIKILSEYKSLYLRKKQETVKNFLKLLLSKEQQVQNCTLSSIIQMSILSDRQIKKDHKVYIKAYEEQLLMSLLGIYNKSLSKKPAYLEQQMKKMYDRLVVVCQVSIAEKCVEKVALDVEKDICYNVQMLTKKAINEMQQSPCAIEIIANQNYMEHKVKKQEKNIKDEVVKHIFNILASEFAKQFPKKK